MPTDTTPTCSHCGAPYDIEGRGCCRLCIQLGYLNYLATLTLLPGKSRQ